MRGKWSKIKPLKLVLAPGHPIHWTACPRSERVLQFGSPASFIHSFFHSLALHDASSFHWSGSIWVPSSCQISGFPATAAAKASIGAGRQKIPLSTTIRIEMASDRGSSRKSSLPWADSRCSSFKKKTSKSRYSLCQCRHYSSSSSARFCSSFQLIDRFAHDSVHWQAKNKS